MSDMLDATAKRLLLSPVLDRQRRGALKGDGARCSRALDRHPPTRLLPATAHGHAHQRRRSLLSTLSPSRRTPILDA